MELMSVNIGPLYIDMSNTKTALMALMASCSVGQLGALNAESFCERVLSCANNIVQTNNTLLDDVEVAMLVVFRMNKVFMEFMGLHYADVGREQFGMQVVM